MKKMVKVFSLILSFALMCSFGACSLKGNSKYNIVSRLGKQQLCVAFREGDKAGDAVIAALAVLQAEGEVSKISRDWFNDDLSKLKGDGDALEKLDMEIGERSFNVGYDAAHLPYSGVDSGGTPLGFDIDLARAVFDLLGWRARFIAIDVSQAAVELKSGNVDCVWGGYAMQEGAKGIRFSPVYMTNTVIAASLNGSGITGEKAISGKTLAVSESGQFAAALDAAEGVAERAEYLVILPGGAVDALNALDEGKCDVVISDLAMIEYYGG